jgi:hypothetical protein
LFWCWSIRVRRRVVVVGGDAVLFGAPAAVVRYTFYWWVISRILYVTLHY